MNTLWSRVTGHTVITGQVIYVAANGDREKVSFGTCYQPGYAYCNVYIDSPAPGNFVGAFSGIPPNRLTISGQDYGDLPQRRFAIKVDNASAGALVNVTETIRSNVSGG